MKTAVLFVHLFLQRIDLLNNMIRESTNNHAETSIDTQNHIYKRCSSSCFTVLDFFRRFTAGTFPEVKLERTLSLPQKIATTKDKR